MTSSQPSSIAVALILARHSIARFLRTRRAWIALALCVLPAAAAATMVALGGQLEVPELREGLRTHGWMGFLQVVVPVLALLVCTPAIGDEIEDGTIAYLTTRPVSRVAIFLGRFAGAMTWLLALLLVGGLAVTLASDVPPADLVRGLMERTEGSEGRAAAGLILTSLVGGLTYGAVFTALGVILRRAMIFGISYVFAMENFLSNLPGKARALTLQHHLRELLRSLAPGNWGPPPRFGKEEDPDLAAAVMVLSLVTVAALLLGAWVLRRRAFVRAGDGS